MSESFRIIMSHKKHYRVNVDKDFIESDSVKVPWSGVVGILQTNITLYSADQETQDFILVFGRKLSSDLNEGYVPIMFLPFASFLWQELVNVFTHLGKQERPSEQKRPDEQQERFDKQQEQQSLQQRPDEQKPFKRPRPVIAGPRGDTSTPLSFWNLDVTLIRHTKEKILIYGHDDALPFPSNVSVLVDFELDTDFELDKYDEEEDDEDE
jgi:hypothetical protein